MNGFNIDKVALKDVRKQFEDELLQIENRLNAKVKSLMGDTPINLNSPEQVSQVIYSRILYDKKNGQLPLILWKEKKNLNKLSRTIVL